MATAGDLEPRWATARAIASKSLHFQQPRAAPTLRCRLCQSSTGSRCTSGWPVNVEIEPKSTFAAPLAASPWARAAPSRAGPPYQPPPALGSRPASSAGFSCWAARQQELDLRHVQRVVTAPLWLPSFGARDGNDPRHPLHRVGVLGSGGRHSPATSVGCPSLATAGVPSSRLLGAAHSEDFISASAFNSNTPCMSTSVAIEAQPLAVACWPSAAPTVAIGRHAGISTF